MPADASHLLDAFDALRVRDDLADGAPVERDGSVLRVLFPHRAMIATPRDTGARGRELDALIRRQVERFAELDSEAEWKHYAHDLPEDLPERLVAAGFVPEERETVVVGEASALARLPVEVPGVVIRDGSADGDLAAIGRLESEVWGEDWSWLVDDLRTQRDRLGADGIRILVAEAAGEVVSAAWMVPRRGSSFAGLWGGSTHAAFRGRGIYRALVAQRARIAHAAGYRHLQVDASDMSRPILERLGFAALTTTTPYVWSPGT